MHRVLKRYGADPCVGDLELSQYVLWHVVLGHWIDDEVLVASRALSRPVLVTLLLHKTQIISHMLRLTDILVH